MSVTEKLLALYRVDQKLTGLKSRLRQAENYLRQQQTLLKSIEEMHSSLTSQTRQLEATVHNDQNEITSLDERIAKLRDRMQTASTSKEHSALLTEMNTIKADRGLIETRAVESLEQLDLIRARVSEIVTQREERERVRVVAQQDRDQRASDIAGKVEELETEREGVLRDVPSSALNAYNELLELGLDDVMATVEEQDRRNKEYSCGACYTHLPVEQLNILMNKGDLTKCPTCGVILYLEQDLFDSISGDAEKKRRKRAIETTD